MAPHRASNRNRENSRRCQRERAGQSSGNSGHEITQNDNVHPQWPGEVWLIAINDEAQRGTDEPVGNLRNACASFVRSNPPFVAFRLPALRRPRTIASHVLACRAGIDR